MSDEPEAFFGDAPEAVPAGPRARPPRPVRPRGRPVRMLLLSFVLLVAVAVGVVDHEVHGAVAAPPAPLAVGTVPAPDVESSAWYCAGATSTAGTTGAMTVNLTNTTDRPVAGTLEAVSDVPGKGGTFSPGKSASESLVVPAVSEVTRVPGALVGGSFVAATVTLAGGGVLATESVAGPLGWSESSCARATAPDWYFASGATEKGDTLYLALYNPTPTEAVVDTTFITPAGTLQPVPFEGIVLAPGQLATEEVDSYVQDDSSVSTIVNARTGAVVAAELEAHGAGATGVSVRMGVPQVAAAWAIPSSIDVAGGATSISVFNPTTATDTVAVSVRPGIAAPARFTKVVGPRSTWVLDTSGETRIPTGLDFLATVSVVRGPGVVVDRTLAAPAGAPAPRFGSATALTLSPAGTGSVVAAPGDDANPAVPRAAIDGINLANVGRRPVAATLWALEGPAGRVRLATVTIDGRASRPVALNAAPPRVAVEVTTAGRVVVSEDLGPSAVGGVVSLGAAPAA